MRAISFIAAALAALAASATAATETPACSAQSTATVPPVVELYTSEGCSSCPPADRWLSQLLKTRPEVVAMAYHVDYWDRLGWKDRFADPAHTARQYVGVKRQRGGFAYTPQVVLDGQDHRNWSGNLPAPAEAAPAPLRLVVTRTDNGYRADLASTSTKPLAVQLHWALTENGHSSDVRAGENGGVTLKHDAVVRDWGQMPSTTVAANGTQSYTLTPTPARKPERPRSLAVVVSDPASGRPLQALKLGC